MAPFSVAAAALVALRARDRKQDELNKLEADQNFEFLDNRPRQAGLMKRVIIGGNSDGDPRRKHR